MLLKALFTYLLVTAVLYLIGVTQSESVVMSLLCSVEYFFFSSILLSKSTGLLSLPAHF